MQYLCFPLSVKGDPSTAYQTQAFGWPEAIVEETYPRYHTLGLNSNHVVEKQVYQHNHACSFKVIINGCTISALVLEALKALNKSITETLKISYPRTAVPNVSALATSYPKA